MHSGGSVIFYITKLHQVGGKVLGVCVCVLYQGQQQQKEIPPQGGAGVRARGWEKCKGLLAFCYLLSLYVHSSPLGKELKQGRNLRARKKKTKERERRGKGGRNQENKIKGGKREKSSRKGKKKGKRGGRN